MLYGNHQSVALIFRSRNQIIARSVLGIAASIKASAHGIENNLAEKRLEQEASVADVVA